MNTRLPNLVRRALPAALLLGCACSDGTGPGDVPVGDLRATILRGAAQSGTVGVPLPDSVVVQVGTVSGAAAPGVELHWKVLDGAGETSAATTRTDAAGRSGIVWVLGPVAGIQRLEVSGTSRGETAVLDTVVATAEPGSPVAVRILGDSIREMAVGDTARLEVQGADRFGNAISAERLGARWSSSQPSVAQVDSSGRVLARALGTATIEARAGTAAAHVRLRAGAAVESFLVSGRSHAVTSGFVSHAGRTFAVTSTIYRTEVRHDAVELVNGAWSSTPVVAGSLTVFPVRPYLRHVTPGGTAYVGVGLLFASPRPGQWAEEDTVLRRQIAPMAASGNVFFGYISAWDSPTWDVVRREAGLVTSLGLPAPYNEKTYRDEIRYLMMASAAADELYVNTRSALLHWNGREWGPVPSPDGGGAFALRSLVAPIAGGAAYGLAGTNLLYRLSGGRAERIANPGEATGDTIRSVSFTADGEPILVGDRAVHFRWGGEWRKHTAPEGFTVQSAGGGAKGEVWVAISRPTGETDYYGPLSELRFQRLVVER